MNLARLATAIRLLGPVVTAVADALEADDAAARPALTTQHNVEADLGIPRGVFLDLLRRHTFPLRVVRVGSTRAVDRAAFVRWLEDDGPAKMADAGGGDGSDVDAGGITTEAALKEWGLESRPGSNTNGKKGNWIRTQGAR